MEKCTTPTSNTKIALSLSLSRSSLRFVKNDFVLSLNIDENREIDVHDTLPRTRPATPFSSLRTVIFVVTPLLAE